MLPGLHHAIVGPDQQGALPHDAIEPCATVTAAGNHMVAQAPMVGANHEHSVARNSRTEPAAVVTSGGGGGGLFVTGGRENNIPRRADQEPAATVTAAHCGGGLSMIGGNREHNQARDASREPAPVVTTAEGGGLYAITGADGFLVQVAGNTFERPGYTRAWPVSSPAPTQSTTPERALVMPPLEQDGLAISRDAVIASYYGTGDNVRPAIEPSATQTAVDRHALLVPAGGTRQQQIVDASVEPSPTRLTRDSHAVTHGSQHTG